MEAFEFLYKFIFDDNERYKMVNWFISFHPILPQWKNQPSYLISQLVFTIGFVLTLIHAFSHKRKWLHLWFACLINGIITELISYSVPYLDCFWHSPCPIMFFGNRLPPHIIFFYPNFFYTGIVFASLLNLSKFRYLAAGFLTLIIDFPYELVGVKYIQFSWHDTDQILGDRIYWIPWISNGFLFLYPVLLATFFSTTKIKKSLLYSWKGVFLSALFSFTAVLAILAAIFNFLHDFHGVHTQVTVLVLHIVSLSVLCMSNFNKTNDKQNNDMDSKKITLLIIYLVLHFSVFLGIVLFYNPEDQISVGWHQPIGNCNETEPVYTILGKVLERKKYLCFEDYNEDYFSFHCVSNFTVPTDEILDFYTICGTPFENKIEYITILIGNIVVASIVFGGILFSIDTVTVKRKIKNK